MHKWGWRIVGVLFGVPLVLVFNAIAVCAVLTPIRLAGELATGQAVWGYLSDAGGHVVHGRSGDEHYCYGLFDADDGSYSDHKVSVYVSGYCFDAGGQRALLIKGLATPVTQHITDPDLYGPMAFNGLFGMTDGALVGKPGGLLKALWPLAFLLPIAALADLGVLYMFGSFRRKDAKELSADEVSSAKRRGKSR